MVGHYSHAPHTELSTRPFDIFIGRARVTTTRRESATREGQTRALAQRVFTAYADATDPVGSAAVTTAPKETPTCGTWASSTTGFTHTTSPGSGREQPLLSS